MARKRKRGWRAEARRAGGIAEAQKEQERWLALEMASGFQWRRCRVCGGRLNHPLIESKCTWCGKDSAQYTSFRCHPEHSEGSIPRHADKRDPSLHLRLAQDDNIGFVGGPKTFDARDDDIASGGMQ